MEFPRHCLYVVTSPDCPKAMTVAESHLFVGREALEGGADVVQFRNKDGRGENALPFEQALAVCFNLKKFCEDRGKVFLVNDDLRLAAESGAHGVHFGQEDLKEYKLKAAKGELSSLIGGVRASRVRLNEQESKESIVETARQVLGPGAIVGLSASNLEEALQAAADGADYVGFGPVFATESKEDAATPAGLEALTQLRRKFDADGADAPIVAIGGITQENAVSVMAAGAHGLAVISAVSLADDIEEAARRLKQVIASTTSRA